MSQKNPNISVDCVVFGFDFENLNVLLIEQRQDDNINQKTRFAIPGDLVNADEDLDSAAYRVLKELTSIEKIYLKQFHAFGDPKRLSKKEDKFWLQKLRTQPDARVITVSYFSLIKMSDVSPKASSFAGNTHWVNINQIPRLAFDHNKIFNKALETLRDDLEYKQIGFELLPKKFTLSQLQKLHEVVLGSKLDKRNFRKKMKKNDNVVPLNEKQKGVLHKPAQLFKFEPKEESEIE